VSPGKRVVVADDDVLVREGIVSVLSGAGYEVVGQARDADELGAAVRDQAPVLAQMAEGRSNSGIAGRLFITEGAVEKHVRSILSKLDLPTTQDSHRRVLAVLTFLGAR
jgi:serine/threonine-protein kinase PknK